MTPKEKANELIWKYSFSKLAYYGSEEDIKQCALIAVNEIIFSHIINGIIDYDVEVYWDSVKQEIEKL